MAFELMLLGALIFIFIVSFCGLLQKIKQTYERERILAERLARRREYERTHRNSNDSFSEIYINPSFATEEGRSLEQCGIFPAAPPPYTQYVSEPPPKYDDVVKVHQPLGHTGTDPPPVHTNTDSSNRNINNNTNTDSRSSVPPPYTISV